MASGARRRCGPTVTYPRLHAAVLSEWPGALSTFRGASAGYIERRLLGVLDRDFKK